MRIGTAGNADIQSAINVTTERIEWVIGDRSQVGPNAPLEARGKLTEIHAPDYGYVRGSLILHERENRLRAM